jgi:predicted acylesterase/phospholipase RssA
MEPALPFQLNEDGKWISDIHRKLASIKEELRSELTPDDYTFLSGKTTTRFDTSMASAISAFKRKHKLENNGVCDEKTWHLLDAKAGSVYSEVWQYELDALAARRALSEESPGSSSLTGPWVHGDAEPGATEQQERSERSQAPAVAEATPAEQIEVIRAGAERKVLTVRPADEDKVVMRAHGAELAGLAFSGGGIRSATFNLGILQALAEKKMLGDFDYLSTVSGGGYIGAWYSKWLKRSHGNIETLQKNLAPGTKADPVAREPDEIRFLRQYSNYLTPRTGLFSADTWALLATYFRNMVLNLTILVALLAAVLILPHLLSLLVGAYGKDYAEVFAWVGVVTALWSVFFIALSISSAPNPLRRQWVWGQTQGSILALVVLPLMVSAIASSVAVWMYQKEMSYVWGLIPPGTEHPVLKWVLLPGALYFAAWATGWLLAQWRNGTLKWRGPRALWMTLKGGLGQGFGHFACAVVALGVGVLLLLWSVALIRQWDRAAAALDGPSQAMYLAAYGMPVMLSIFGVATILAVGLVGRMYSDKSREWWSRQGGWTAICMLAWVGLATASLFAAPMLGYVHANLNGWIEALLGSAWLGTTLAGLHLGRGNETGKRGASPYFEWVAALAPPLFSIGALLLISTLAYFMMLPAPQPSEAVVTWGVDKQWHQEFSNYFKAAGSISALKAAIVTVLLLVVGGGVAWRVDVNKFSLYMMYRNRLVRAYLGASNRERNPHPFTGFDEKDDWHLDRLLGTDGVIQRPYPIINASLNLVNGKELAWQTRKAAGFSFTPAFCGFELPNMASCAQSEVMRDAARGCYRPTAKYRDHDGVRLDEETGVKLGMAVAISGAAVSPNMGYHSSPALSFLMTLFNVRLGRWFANPRRKNWTRPAPRFGIPYLLSELFGKSDSDARYVYLSDGGHFENLGIYELVRRRCRLIVVIDASADSGLNFEDLGNAIRKCATDLHIEINIDVRDIEAAEPKKFSKANCVVGSILYERTDRGAQNGTLLYIKPSLMETEFADLRNYGKANESFPHQSTADQWFDETQFESYRSLGYRIGMRAFKAVPPPPPGAPPTHRRSIPDLAEALKADFTIKQEEHEKVKESVAGAKTMALETDSLEANTKEDTGTLPKTEPAGAPDPIKQLDEKIK